ncbi:MAG: bifunctional D-glycero-beta-D-manno-heptose-7-phosphate kinase/D-glycero-beta-D-manno-heptose 1-phosphate adenylyltransferase HldE [Gammaproteobacteria bacterium]
MLKHFQPSATARVLVTGDVILDRYVHGVTDRVSPEAPVPIVRVHHTEERPGGAANVAVNIRSLGVSVSLLGLAGNDDGAEVLNRQLTALDIDTCLYRQDGFPTTTKLRVLSRHQQLLRLDYEIDAGGVDASVITEPFRKLLPDCRTVVLSDYAKGSLGDVRKLIAMAHVNGIPVIVDPKGEDFRRYAGASLLTPNWKEFEAAAGGHIPECDIEAAARRLCHDLDIEALLVTRGEQGMSLVRRGAGESLHLAAHSHEVFDVTGAGDTVVAAIAAALASGCTLPDAVAYANYAAGLVVEKLGTASISAVELNHAVSADTHDGQAKFLDDESLDAVMESVRSKGARLVMTNGCFDILHAGHVDCLEQARALGDCLVVAVNDDDSVRRLKGEGRPVNRLAERMAVLAGLSAVDWIIPFAGDTPEALIQRISPDYLVKGGDYQPDRIAGASRVRARGGEVVILPLRPGCSTSSLLETMNSRAPEADS